MEVNVQAYLDEADELLAVLEEALLELEQNLSDSEAIARVFRAMHTLKGSGSMFGFERVANFTHHIETVYDKVRAGNLSANTTLVSLTLKACDHIKTLLHRPDEADGGLHASLEQDFVSFGSSQTAAPAATETAPAAMAAAGGEACWRIEFAPEAEIFLNGTNPLSLLLELEELGECRVIGNIDKLPALDDANYNPEHCYARWDIFLTTAADEASIRDVFIFVEDLSHLRIARISEDPERRLGEILVERGELEPQELSKALAEQSKLGHILVEQELISPASLTSALAEQEQVRQKVAKTSEPAASLRVASDKLDHLVNLVGELVIVQARLSQLAVSRIDPEILGVAEEVERLSAELRESTMNIRMLPIGSSFGRFKRLVRDLSAELGKEIDFVTLGAETELDKTVLEKLGDPLVHLIRNSLDHGVETPEERLKAGKPAAGTIEISAEHAGSSVLIRVRDDGKGLDPELIRRKAIDKGLINADAVLSEGEINALIFAPGFSTASQVSNISGRGVGMDVVARSIEALGGAVEITSAKGRGTTITLRLPLTLAIIEGLLVAIGNERFVIPLASVLECIEVERDINSASQLIKIRENLVPYVVMRDIFNATGVKPLREHVVITEVGNETLGLVVDTVIGQQQTVIKNLNGGLTNLKGIAGATILGDGSVALVLDLKGLLPEKRRDEAQALACS